MDREQHAAVTGGGLHAPANPIGIGGAGITLATAQPSDINGGVATALGGRIKIGRLGEQVRVSPSRTRVVALPAATLFRCPSTDGFPCSFQPSFDPVGVIVRGSSAKLGITIPKRYLHDGATLSKVEIFFRVRYLVLIPANKPRVLYIARWSGTTPATSLGPYQLQAWAANTAYSLNDVRCPTETKTTGFYYKATVGGTSHATTEPAWPTVIGGTVTDGGVTWSCDGNAGQMPHPPGYDEYYASGESQVITADVTVDNVISRASYRYDVAVANFDSTHIIHGLKLHYTAIADLRPE
jgi:hypothetical protein